MREGEREGGGGGEKEVFFLLKMIATLKHTHTHSHSHTIVLWKLLQIKHHQYSGYTCLSTILFLPFLFVQLSSHLVPPLGVVVTSGSCGRLKGKKITK